MAEMIFREMLAQKGLTGQFEADSCATSREEIWNGVGNPIYPPAKQELERHGIPVLPHRARQIAKEDYESFDLILCMDRNNLSALHRLLGGDPHKKISLLMTFAGDARDVADPWYTDRFDIAYRDIWAGCAALLDTLLRKS
jgi:protein-tyrosine phosphatase